MHANTYCVYTTNASGLRLRGEAMALYNQISLWRSRRKVSRRQLADAVGVNPQTIGFIERGDYGPSLELAMAIAAELQAPLQEVFSRAQFESQIDVEMEAADGAFQEDGA